MKALQAIRRFVSNHPLLVPPLLLVAAYVIGFPIFIVVARVVTRFIDADPDAADALLMDAIMWTSAAFFVLTPLSLALYALFRLAKWLGDKARNDITE
jgi:hypothetical protein